MTTIDHRRGLFAVVGLAAAIGLAACGATGSGTEAPSAQVPTPAPATATPAAATAGPTPSPTTETTQVPTPSPTRDPNASPSDAPASAPADLGGFGYAPGDVLDYYVGEGFVCEDPKPSTQAAGYTQVRCLKAGEGDAPTAIVSLVVSDKGVTGDAFAGYVTPAGTKGPETKAAYEHLAGFLGAMLGTDAGTEAATWLAQNLGKEQAQTRVGEILVGTYPEDDAGGVGSYVELANQAFMDAPVP